MAEKLSALKARLSDIVNINNAASVLGWDQQVNLPPGGAASRAMQLSTLARISHEMMTSDETARLLDDSLAEVDESDYDSDDASLLRVFQRDFELATKYPSDYVVRLSQHRVMGHEIWAKARANNDFASFQPHLETLMDLLLEGAEYTGYESNPYDALISQYERDLNYEQIKAIFDTHKPQLVELIAAISAVKDRVDASPVNQYFPIDKQREFGLWVVEKLGFDFQRGRQDVAVHPFATNFSRDDVRITTRFEENFLNPALFGLMHEAGHGMYEQGTAPALENTILASGTSLSIHESQSRLWENVVGRSKGFWQWALPELKKTFPDQLGNIDLDTFYKAINKVEPSYIRVEADEATYNLHIMLRFELENDLINGRVKVADLPQEWNARFNESFGITPPTDTLGVLQDVHWSEALFGYFPTYALGNLLSMQFYNKAVGDHPEIPEQITQGEFSTLLNWMSEKIYQHGRKYNTRELTERVTGSDIDSGPYIAYLQDKYKGVYGL